MTTQLTQAQRDLLTAAAAADDNGLAIQGPDLLSAKTLVRRGLCVTLPPKYGSSRSDPIVSSMVTGVPTRTIHMDWASMSTHSRWSPRP